MRLSSWRPYIVVATELLFLISITILLGGIRIAVRGGVDFSQLYTAGYMIRSGNASSLYDFTVEQPLYNSVIPSEGRALPFDHPAYEALIFAPLSLLKYRDAYFTFLAVNVALLSMCIVILRPRLLDLADIWQLLPLAIFACFLPVTIALGQGQDSLLLLTLVSGAVVAIDNDREAMAGAFVGAALFKFQFAIPIAVLFFLWRRWRFVAGFAVTGLLAAILSVLVVGWQASIAFVYRLGSISVGLHTTEDQTKFGVRPAAMANVRGLCYALFGPVHHGAQIATVAMSGALLICAARRKPSFDLAILFAALVSYHGLLHDMSLLVIPIGMMLLIGYTSRDRWKVCVAAILLIAPTVLAIAGRPFFLLSIPMIAALLLGFHSEPQLQPLTEPNG